MNAEKLCPHCGEWSSWKGSIDDRCQHCNEHLRKEEIVYEEKREAKRRQLELNFKEKWPFSIRPGDNLLIKLLKHSGYALYFVFMSIISVFLWIMFWIVS